MSYDCWCKPYPCKSRAEHIGTGPFVSASAMPTRKSEVADGTRAEKQMSKDHAAYKRMKAEGLQPKSVRGVAAVEARATDAREITEGKIIGKEKLRERDIVRKAMQDVGMVK